MPSTATIEHVSDTALWVAALRAREAEQKSPLFRDPLAAVLAGERGAELGNTLPGRRLTQWVMGLRTQALDRLLSRAIELGVDTVLNLGAGLDTRPYRLELPASLRWVEVDFASIVDLKNERLAEYRPHCRLERVVIDLSDEGARNEALTALLRESRSTAVLTEGLLMYLEPEQVHSLATELHGQPAVRYWLQDYHNGPIPGFRRKALARKLERAPWRFEVEDWFAYVRERGFEVEENILLTDEVRRLRRWPPGWPLFLLGHLFSSRETREKNRSRAGWAMLRKSSGCRGEVRHLPLG